MGGRPGRQHCSGGRVARKIPAHRSGVVTADGAHCSPRELRETDRPARGPLERLAYKQKVAVQGTATFELEN